MFIKIIYDHDDPCRGKVIDAATGEIINGIVSIHIDLLPDSALATLVFKRFDLDLIAEAITEGKPSETQPK